MIGNNLLKNREESPLNIPIVKRKGVVVTSTNVKVNDKETSEIPVTKAKTTTGVENNEEITLIN